MRDQSGLSMTEQIEQVKSLSKKKWALAGFIFIILAAAAHLYSGPVFFVFSAKDITGKANMSEDVLLFLSGLKMPQKATLSIQQNGFDITSDVLRNGHIIAEPNGIPIRDATFNIMPKSVTILSIRDSGIQNQNEYYCEGAERIEDSKSLPQEALIALWGFIGNKLNGLLLVMFGLFAGLTVFGNEKDKNMDS